MTENKPSGVPLAWAYECHNKYQKRGDYDERIDVDEWREGVSLFEPSGPRYRNIRPLWADPLGAAWMREQAAHMITRIAEGYEAGGDGAIACAMYLTAGNVRAIPDPKPADQLEQAMKLPEIAALVEAFTVAGPIALQDYQSHTFILNAEETANVKKIESSLAALVQP